MAEQIRKITEDSEEPVNLLYLATQQGLNCKEIKLNEPSNSQPNSLDETLAITPETSNVQLPSVDREKVQKLETDVKASEGHQIQKNAFDGNQQPATSAKRPPGNFRPRQFSSHAVEEKDIHITCPRVNCPEKIIICLDISHEMEDPTFRSRVGDKFSSIQLIKRALGIFMNSKHLIDARHEFALVYLQDAAFWMSDFTSEPRKILTILEDMSSCVPTSSFDMSSIFDVIQQNVRLPTVSNPHVIPPPYVVRTILLYGRSHCIPTFSNTKSQLQLNSSPYFFMDAYYLHQVPSDENKCEVIFDVLCSLDRTGLSYINEVSRNPTKLYDCMAQLLPHPLQRPIQRHACYDIEDQVTPLSMCTSGPPPAVASAAS